MDGFLTLDLRKAGVQRKYKNRKNTKINWSIDISPLDSYILSQNYAGSSHLNAAHVVRSVQFSKITSSHNSVH